MIIMIIVCQTQTWADWCQTVHDLTWYNKILIQYCNGYKMLWKQVTSISIMAKYMMIMQTKALPQATLPYFLPQQKHPSKHAMAMHNDHTDNAPPYQYDDLPPYIWSRTIVSITNYKNTSPYVDLFPLLYKIPAYITKKRNKNHAHDKYLYCWWNCTTTKSQSNKKTCANNTS